MIWKTLGESLTRSNHFDDGATELTTYLKIKPDDAEAHYFLGVALRGQGKKEEAIAEFKQAIQLDPQQPLYAIALERTDPEHYPASANAMNATAAQLSDGYFQDNTYTNRFLKFSYTYPAGWHVLPAKTGTVFLRAGAAFVGGTDPFAADAQELVARQSVPLLVVAKVETRDLAANASAIQIQAPELKLGGKLPRSKI